MLASFVVAPSFIEDKLDNSAGFKRLSLWNMTETIQRLNNSTVLEAAIQTQS